MSIVRTCKICGKTGIWAHMGRLCVECKSQVQKERYSRERVEVLKKLSKPEYLKRKNELRSKRRARKNLLSNMSEEDKVLFFQRENLQKESIRKESRRIASKKCREKRRLHPNCRICKSMSGRIRDCIKKNRKTWLKYVPYSIDELMERLKSTWTEGMSWENYGVRGWHIDHIRPISSFNITSYECEDFKKCWALENLRALWARDNLIKNSYWEGKAHHKPTLSQEPL